MSSPPFPPPPSPLKPEEDILIKPTQKRKKRDGERNEVDRRERERDPFSFNFEVSQILILRSIQLQIYNHLWRGVVGDTTHRFSKNVQPPILLVIYLFIIII